MKILLLANELKNDVSSSGTKLKKITASGYDIAKRNAIIYKLGYTHKYYNATRCISDKLIKSTTKKELPYLAGALGLLIPLPFMCPILMGLGFLIRFSNFSLNTNKT